MRRIVWLGTAALIALAAAIPLWLILDDDGGERRAAALTESINEAAARLTIQGVNEGKPFTVQSYSWGAERQAGGVQLNDLVFTREVSEISPQLFDIAAPSATLELLTPGPTGPIVVSLIYEFTDVAIHTYEDASEFFSPGKSGSASVARGRTTTRMTFAAVRQRFSFTPQNDVVIGLMNVSTVEGKGVAIHSFKFGFEKRPNGELRPDRLMVTRWIDKLAPWFSTAVTGGTPPGTNVTIELVRPNPNTAATETYATYDLTDVTVESVRDFDTRYDNDNIPPVQEIELSFASAQLTSGGKKASLPSP